MFIVIFRSRTGSLVIVRRRCDHMRSGGVEFDSCFWAFGPCVRTFQNTCRSMLTVDGTHLLGKYLGVLLVACAIDGNNKMLPVAYAVVEIEKRETWQWFLGLLREHILTHPGENNYRLDTILSDKQKGLIQAVQNVLPSTAHAFCMKHMEANLKKDFNDAYLRVNLWKAATSYRVCEYDAAVARMKEQKPEIEAWLAERPAIHWSNAHFPGRKYGHTTTSVSESCNNVLKGAISMSITALVEHTRQRMTSWYNNRRTAAQDWNSHLTPYARTLVTKMQKLSAGYTVQPVDVSLFQVNSHHYQDVVDLQTRECTCRRFQDMGIPCAHAMAAINFRQADVKYYVEQWYEVFVYQLSYRERIIPTIDRSQWPAPTEPIPRVLPPLYRRGVGRPRKKRIRSIDDENRVKYKCSACRQLGHNKRGCPNPPVRASDVPRPMCTTAPLLA